MKAAVLAALFLLSACAGAPKRGPVAAGPEAQAVRREALASLAERGRSLKGLRGLATVRYGSKLWGVQGETAFALRRPDELRVDALSDFGAFASQVVLTRGRLLIVWPADGLYFDGPADREAMDRFLRIGLEPREVVDVFLGILPLEGEAAYRLVKSDDRGAVLAGGEGEITARRHEGAYVPVRYVARDGEGRVRYEVEYDDYRGGPDGLLPGRLRAEFRDPKSRIEVRFKDVESNPKLGQNVFQRKIPENAKPLDN